MNMLIWLIEEIAYKPVNLILFVVLVVLIVRLLCSSRENSKAAQSKPEDKPLPPLRRDFTLQELREYDGEKQRRILFAVNGNVYDVTKGAHFYGKGGPYHNFAGRDASRGLATFCVSSSDEYDDLSDLKPSEMESIREWEEQIKERYIFVGKLLKPGEEPSIYPENEDITTNVADN